MSGGIVSRYAATSSDAEYVSELTGAGRRIQAPVSVFCRAGKRMPAPVSVLRPYWKASGERCQEFLLGSELGGRAGSRGRKQQFARSRVTRGRSRAALRSALFSTPKP